MGAPSKSLKLALCRGARSACGCEVGCCPGASRAAAKRCDAASGAEQDVVVLGIAVHPDSFGAVFQLLLQLRKAAQIRLWRSVEVCFFFLASARPATPA